MNRMIEHALSSAPRECCGVLGGKGAMVTSVHPVPNDHESPGNRFNANPDGLFAAVKKMRLANEDMIGIFHSHPGGPPEPSAIDRSGNHYPGIFYFIISLMDGDPEVRCYIMGEDREFTPVDILGAS